MIKKKIVKTAIILTVIFALAGVGLLLYLRSLPAPQGFPILEYHRVTKTDNSDGYSYNVPPPEFAAQMDYLVANGYTTITLIDFMKAKKGKFTMPEKPIIITFDDGYTDNFHELLPILTERKMKAVVFMITNNINEKGYLTWDELRALQENGMEIGSHSANHLPITTLDAEKADEEVRLSKLLMEWNGIKTVFAFSYPNGKYDAKRDPVLLRDNEYLCAVTGDAGLNNEETDPYLLKRINVPHPRFGIYEFRWRLYKAELAERLNLALAIFSGQ